MDPAIGCLILLGVMALLFITELIPLAVTAMGGAIICGFLNFIPDNVVFSGLSHPTVTLFAGMFVVGAAMFHTGLAHSIGVFIVKRAGKSQKNLMLCIMIVAAVLSMCLSIQVRRHAFCPWLWASAQRLKWPLRASCCRLLMLFAAAA